MTLEKQRQSVSSRQLLQAMASGEDINLTRCVITGDLDINRFFDPEEQFDITGLDIEEQGDYKRITFAQELVFDKCVFKENAVFAAPWSDPDRVSVEFKQDVVFNSSQFKAQLRFRNSTFNGSAGFDGCDIKGVATFKNVIFRDEAKFRTVSFGGYSLFGNAVFEKGGRFNNTHFVRGVNLADVNFKDSVDFSGVYSSSRAIPVYENIKFSHKRFGEDETFWRFVKQSAQEAGYYQLAGECFYHERCAHLWSRFHGSDYKILSRKGKLWRILSGIHVLPEFIFGRLLFGYGERPVRVLAACVLVILFCGVLYSFPDTLERLGQPVESSLRQGIYFSAITFSTLGYGDLYPRPESFARIVAMVEAFLGACLMALFIVSLAKRFSRT